MKRKTIRSSWKEYFNFSSRERRGTIFLIFILLAEVVFLYIQRNRSYELTQTDPELIASIIKSISERDSLMNEKKDVPVNVDSKPEYFYFDPNTIDKISWMKLGLSEKQINIIENFKAKGGSFKIKKDLKKMYCISSKKFSELEPFISLPDSFYRPSFRTQRIKQALSPSIINLQTADSSQLISLKGIGPVLAGRIIKYREKLGGFHDKGQLKEVWGINDTLFNALLPEITLDENPFRLIKLNTDSFEVIAAHPYIKGKIAGLICKYRKQHAFKTIDELMQVPLLTEENFLKLAPYLSTE